MRHAVWLLGVMLLGLLAFKFVSWQLVFQLILIVCLSLWVVVGAVLLTRREIRRNPEDFRTADMRRHMAAQAVRAQYVASHGEAAAAKVDTVDPQFWTRAASVSGASK